MQIPFSKISSGKEEKEAVCRVLDSGWWAAGEEVAKFEEEFAKYIGAKYFIFTNSCTSALKMSYKYFKELGYKYYYLNEPNTFCATYSAAEEMGLIGVNKIFKDTITVNMHYGGVFQDKECLIEDSAHRIEPNDKWVGKIKCYSFYATKNMSCGSGGGLATNDKEIYERCRTYWRDGLSTSTSDRLKEGGKKHNYSVLCMAGGYDGNDIAASIGREQLKKLPEFIKRRNEIVKRYNEAFNQTWQGNHLYPFFVQRPDQVDQLIEFMDKKGIKCGYHYPNTGWLGVSLPLYPLLTDEEVTYIINSVGEYAKVNIF
jgi:dTDP-4-amino-4,6-dideoxygalactose transaminase